MSVGRAYYWYSVDYHRSNFWKVCLYSGKKYQIKLTPRYSYDDPDLYLWGADGRFYKRAYAGSGSTDTITFQAGTTGYYWIEVWGYNNRTNYYKLEINEYYGSADIVVY